MKCGFLVLYKIHFDEFRFKYSKTFQLNGYFKQDKDNLYFLQNSNTMVKLIEGQLEHLYFTSKHKNGLLNDF